MIFFRKKAGHIDLVDTEHTPEVEEILGNIPRTVVRYSLVYIFFILVALIVGAYFLKVPEIVTGKITLTTSTPPTTLISKVDGRIISLQGRDGSDIKKGQVIAIIESTLEYDDLQLLETTLDSLTGIWEADVQKLQLPHNVMLGDLQNIYFSFYMAFQDFRFIVSDSSLERKIAIHREMIALKREELAELQKQSSIRGSRHLVSRKLFNRDSSLFSTGVISSKDYDVSFQNYLQEKENYLNFFSGIRTLRASILQTEQTIVEMISARFERTRELQNTLVERLQVLRSQIGIFREKYVFVAPNEGKLTFNKYWSENQYVRQGERIATLVPNKQSGIHGRVLLTSASIGKVEVGQKVNIKLSGFPYMRHGMIEGVVAGVSLVPDSDGYVAEVQLKYGMTSKYRDKLKFVQEMDGVAEIVTEDVRLLEQLISPLRSLVMNRD